MDWKHIALGAAMAVGVPLVHYLLGVDWSHLGAIAPVVGGVLQVANEMLTGGKAS